MKKKTKIIIASTITLATIIPVLVSTTSLTSCSVLPFKEVTATELYHYVVKKSDGGLPDTIQIPDDVGIFNIKTSPNSYNNSLDHIKTLILPETLRSFIYDVKGINKSGGTYNPLPNLKYICWGKKGNYLSQNVHLKDFVMNIDKPMFEILCIPKCDNLSINLNVNYDPKTQNGTILPWEYPKAVLTQNVYDETWSTNFFKVDLTDLDSNTNIKEFRLFTDQIHNVKLPTNNKKLYSEDCTDFPFNFKYAAINNPTNPIIIPKNIKKFEPEAFATTYSNASLGTIYIKFEQDSLFYLENDLIPSVFMLKNDLRNEFRRNLRIDFTHCKYINEYDWEYFWSNSIVFDNIVDPSQKPANLWTRADLTGANSNQHIIPPYKIHTSNLAMCEKFKIQ